MNINDDVQVQSQLLADMKSDPKTAGIVGLSEAVNRIPSKKKYNSICHFNDKVSRRKRFNGLY